MADLIAKEYIQYGYRRYKPGDILPSEVELANAWVESDSAVWREDAPPTRPTAKPVTAMPGMPGCAVGGERTVDELVGRVPITPERKRSG